jgi:hypothetical protein
VYKLVVVEALDRWLVPQDRIRAYFLLRHFLRIGHQVVVMVLVLMIVQALEMQVDRVVRVAVQEVVVMHNFFQAVREILVDIILQKATTVVEPDFSDKAVVEVLEA